MMSLQIHIAGGGDAARRERLEQRAGKQAFQLPQVQAFKVGTAYAVWMGDTPPQTAVHAWYRHHAPGLSVAQEIQAARAQCVRHGLDWVFIHHVPNTALGGAQHLAVGPDGAIRTFAEERDADCFLLEEAANYLPETWREA